MTFQIHASQRVVQCFPVVRSRYRRARVTHVYMETCKPLAATALIRAAWVRDRRASVRLPLVDWPRVGCAQRAFDFRAPPRGRPPLKGHTASESTQTGHAG